jgi:hypothetical protein
MGASKQQVAATYRAAVMPKLDALVRAAAIADGFASLTFDWPRDALAFDLREPTGDTVLVLREDIDGSSTPALRFARLDYDPVRVARQMLDLVVESTDYVDPSHAKFYAAHLEQLARTRYAVIVYTHSVRLPRAEGSLDFVGGLVSGVALVVDLDAMTVRGGIEYATSNRGQVRSTEKMIQHALRDDLAKQFGDVLLLQLGARFPEAQLPVTLGY